MFAGTGEESRGRLAARSIHPHVQRLVTLKAEAAARRFELKGREAEVGERAVHERRLAAIEDVAERPVVRVHQFDSIAPRQEPRARDPQRVQVAVEADEPRRARFEQRAGVSAEADGAIDEQAAAFGTQNAQHLGGHHRHVRHQIPNSDRARASSSVYGSRCSLARKRSWFQTSR